MNHDEWTKLNRVDILPFLATSNDLNKKRINIDRHASALVIPSDSREIQHITRDNDHHQSSGLKNYPSSTDRGIFFL